jgi:F0F1-type ATP synthase membrane subunit c/vacuolar-type H+-ATPase subunit K
MITITMSVALVTLVIAIMAYYAFESMSNNSEAASTVMTYFITTVVLVELLGIVLFVPLLQSDQVSTNLIAFTLPFLSGALGLMGSGWIKAIGKNNEVNYNLVGYTSFALIEFSIMILSAKLFTAKELPSKEMLIFAIGLNTIGLLITGVEFLKSLGRNPSAKNSLIVPAFVVLGAIDFVGLALIGKLFSF